MVQSRFSALIVMVLMPLASWADGAGVSVDVKLSPAGSFKAETSKVQGFAYKKGNGVAAENVLIDLKSIKTGIGLRDKHTRERLMVEKFPQAKLIKAEGQNGKGTATIEIKGIKQEVTGTYKVQGNMLQASFPVNLTNLEIKDVRYMGVGVKETVVINVNLPLQAGPKRSTASKK